METYFKAIKVQNGVLSKYMIIDILAFAYSTTNLVKLFNRLSKNTKRLVEHEMQVIEQLSVPYDLLDYDLDLAQA
jgi:hypothetical protein